VGVCISDLEEGCCDYLTSLSPIKGDKFDNHKKTVDNILECNDKYILIEERSFILDFFRKACIGRKKYSHFIKNGILEDSFFEFLSTLSKIEKREIFQKSSLELLEDIPKKVETTLTYLKDEVKISNSLNIILYCKSEEAMEISSIASILFARYNNEEENTVLECQKLEKFLQQKGCA
jgi:hypothetical protein